MKKVFSSLVLLMLLSSLSAEDKGWEKLEISLDESVWASSVLTETLGGKQMSYGPEALFDNDLSSPWVEGAEGDGIGESVLITTQQIVSRLELNNGFASSSRLFLRNNRIKRLSVSFVAGLTAPGLVTERDYYLYFTREQPLDQVFALEDTPEIQGIDLSLSESEQADFFEETILAFSKDYPDFYAMILKDLGIPPEEGDSLMYRKLIMEMYGFFGIRIAIAEVYPGTHYNDTCLAELELEFEDF